MATARLEKPHCGNSGVPFMNSTTSWLLTMSAMRACGSDMARVPFASLVGNRGGQLQGVERAAHPALERGVDRLVLGDARLALEAVPDHMGGVVVAVAGEVGDGDFGSRETAA